MPISQAMWRPNSPSGKPSLPSRRGIARPAWSAARKKSERPSGRNTRTGDGSSSPSSRAAPPCIEPSIHFGVAGANFCRGKPGDDPFLGPLELQVHIKELAAEPIPGGLARRQIGERLAQRARQRLEAGRTALVVGHLPKAARR